MNANADNPLLKLRKLGQSVWLDDIGRAIETLAGEVPGEDAVHVAIVPGA